MLDKGLPVEECFETFTLKKNVIKICTKLSETDTQGEQIVLNYLLNCSQDEHKNFDDCVNTKLSKFF